jgi:DNA-binding transcriptional LysR family regulator
MDYNRVALFARVVKTGSFTAAARQVGLPKSSVSRSITRLEEDLGVRLLQRTTRRLALTDAGQQYYEAVSGSVRNIDEADAIAKEQGAEPRGLVRMTAPPELDLSEALVAFQKKHRHITIELSLSSRRVDLIAEGFDLALRGGRLEDSSLVARRIVVSNLVLMAAPSYLRKRGRPTSFEELVDHDFVLYRAVNGAATLHLHELHGTGARSLTVRGRLSADDLGFVVDAVAEGAGIGLLPVQAFADRGGELEPVLPGWGAEIGGLHVVMPTAQLIPTRVALLRDFLVEHMGRVQRRAIAYADGCSRKRGRVVRRRLGARKQGKKV